MNPGRVVRAATAVPLVRRTVGRLAARDRGRVDLMAVLTYHRVDEPADDLYPGLISATPPEFERQIDWLVRSYRIVSMAEVVARRNGGSALPPRSVLITFDDGYRDFADHAWPVLRRLEAPVTLFVPTAYPGAPDRAFWWDRLHRALSGPGLPSAVDTPFGRLDLRTVETRGAASRTLRRGVKDMPHDRAMATVDAVVAALGGEAGTPGPGPVLGWDELRQLATDGVELGAHSRTHPLLTRVRPEELADEISGARLDMERELGTAPTAMAYPNGSTSADVRAATEAAGFRVAFTTRRGTNELGHADWLALRRINVGRSTDLALLAAQLHSWFRRWP